MKVFVFPRGINTPFKQQVVSKLMETLNPDINNINAIKISMDQYLTAQEIGDPDLKAASSSCKRIVKKLLMGSHNERFIVIDNESLNPQDWEAYINLSAKLGLQIQAIGLEITDENINTDDFSQKLNLQQKNLTPFILSCYKYYHVNCLDDLKPVMDKITLEFNV